MGQGKVKLEYSVDTKYVATNKRFSARLADSKCNKIKLQWHLNLKLL